MKDSTTVEVGNLRRDLAADRGVEPEQVQAVDAAFTPSGDLVLDLEVDADGE